MPETKNCFEVGILLVLTLVSLLQSFVCSTFIIFPHDPNKSGVIYVLSSGAGRLGVPAVKGQAVHLRYDSEVYFVLDLANRLWVFWFFDYRLIL